MGNLLFSPMGQINSSEFKKGAVILLALNFALWLTWFTNIWLALTAGFIAFCTIYCWACLFIKRFRDANKSGFLFIGAFIVFAVLSIAVIPILVYPLMPVSEATLEQMTKMAEMQQEMMQNPPATVGEMMPLYDQVFLVYQGMALKTAITYFLSGAITAFGVNALIKGRVPHK